MGTGNRSRWVLDLIHIDLVSGKSPSIQLRKVYLVNGMCWGAKWVKESKSMLDGQMIRWLAKSMIKCGNTLRSTSLKSRTILSIALQQNRAIKMLSVPGCIQLVQTTTSIRSWQTKLCADMVRKFIMRLQLVHSLHVMMTIARTSSASPSNTTEEMEYLFFFKF